MKGTVLYEVRDDVAILTVDNPPVNPYDGVRNGLYESLVKAEGDSTKGIVLTETVELLLQALISQNLVAM